MASKGNLGGGAVEAAKKLKVQDGLSKAPKFLRVMEQFAHFGKVLLSFHGRMLLFNGA